MTVFWQTLQLGLAASGIFIAWRACALLCLSGLVLSSFSVSGTWLVLAAASAAHFLVDAGSFPGWPALAGMLCVCIAIDSAEWFAASWGVRRRGGSRAAGWMALLGSLGGMLLGSLLVPIPLVGGLIGMLAGSFRLVYGTELRRLQNADRATHVAVGAVLAGISMLLLKIAATAILVIWLAIGLLA